MGGKGKEGAGATHPIRNARGDLKKVAKGWRKLGHGTVNSGVHTLHL